MRFGRQAESGGRHLKRAPLWMRTMLRLWPGGRAGKRDDAPISDETLRGYLKERDASKDGSR